LSLRKAFWEDTLALKHGGPAPIQPGAHALYYAYHEAFPSWMFGKQIDWQMADRFWNERIAAVPGDDFNFKVVLNEPLIVGYASNSKAHVLRWGPTDMEIVLKTAAGKRLAAETSEWNLKPHIIS
jgi:hypothetical protein